MTSDIQDFLNTIKHTFEADGFDFSKLVEFLVMEFEISSDEAKINIHNCIVKNA